MVVSFFEEEQCTPEKILATPMVNKQVSSLAANVVTELSVSSFSSNLKTVCYYQPTTVTSDSLTRRLGRGKAPDKFYKCD